MPAFGLAAVPLPMKIRRIEPGCHVADALGEATAKPNGPAGPLLLTATAGAAVDEDPFNSRRLAAVTVHASGTNAGESPLLPEPSHANTSPRKPRTPPAAARINGAAATAGDAAGTGESAPTPPGESAISATDSEPIAESADGTTDDRSTDAEFTPADPASPATTERGRGCRTPDAAAPGTDTPEESLPPAVDGDPLPESVAAPPRRPVPAASTLDARTGPRTGDLVEDEADDESDDPVEPPDPVVSANATGTDAIAEPTPNATANAPTRPTYRA
jgi:hypothetical protein